MYIRLGRTLTSDIMNTTPHVTFAPNRDFQAEGDLKPESGGSSASRAQRQRRSFDSRRRWFRQGPQRPSGEKDGVLRPVWIQGSGRRDDHAPSAGARRGFAGADRMRLRRGRRDLRRAATRANARPPLTASARGRKCDEPRIRLPPEPGLSWGGAT